LKARHQVVAVICQIFQLFSESSIDGSIFGGNLSKRVGVVVEIFAVEHADEVGKFARDPARVKAECLDLKSIPLTFLQLLTAVDYA
jgi:hypothetical protein